MTGQPPNALPGSSAASTGRPATRGEGQPASAVVEAAALAVALAVGAYLRLRDLDFAQFRVDDFTLWSLARRFAAQPAVLTQGMDSSLGLANGPFQVYLLAPAALVSSHPLPAYFLVALLNVLGILLFWGFVRSYWGPRVAAVAALLFAVSPWAVVFSRRLLGNDLVAPFTVLLVWSLCDLVRHGRKRDSVLPFLWLAIAVQVYVVALVHLLLAAVGLALGARRLRLAPALGGALLFAALTAPYFVGAALPQIGSLAGLLGQPGASAEVDLTSLRFTLLMVSTEGYQVFANQAGSVVDATAGLPRAASLLAAALYVLGLLIAARRVVRGFRRGDREQVAPHLLAIVAALLPALLLARHASPIYVLYFVTTLPLPFLFVAIGLLPTDSPRLRSLAVAARSAAALALLAVVGTQLVLAQVFFSVVREYWPASDYGLPLRYADELGETIERLTLERGYARTYLAGAGERDAVVYGTLGPALPTLFHFDAADGFVQPDPGIGEVLYVVSSQDRLGAAFAARLAGRQVASLALPGPGVRYSFYGVPAADLDAVTADLSPARSDATGPGVARLGDYLELIGHELPATVPAGGRARVGLAWRVLARPSEDVNLFVHLIGGLGSQWGQWNGLGHPQDRWQPGDVLIEWHEIGVPAGTPPGEYQVEAGGYLRATGARLPVRTDQGANDRLRLGAIEVTRPLAPPRPPPLSPVDVRFGDAIVLRGFDLSAPSARPGDRLRLTLYWESVAAAGADYTVFVHLVGEDPRPVAQADSPPAFGGFPTRAWQPGDLVRDPREVALPADLGPGRYWLLVGLYDPRSGARLAPAAAAPSLLGRLGPWLERRTPLRAGPRADGDRVVLVAVDVGERR